MSQQLLETYKEYALNGEFFFSSTDIFKLIDGLIEHDDISKELYNIYIENNCKNTNFNELKSNGSSGNWENQIYKFGPNFEAVRRRVEEHLTKSKSYKKIMVMTPFPDHWSHDSDYIYKDDYKFYIDISNDKVGITISKFMEKMIYRFKKINFYTFPRLINYLSKNQDFIDFCSKFKDDIILNSTDSDGFFDKSIFIKNNIKVNNHMINWKSGVNFYSDNYNLKTFNNLYYKDRDKYYNLFNMNNKSGCFIDDIIEFKNNTVTKFLPHYQFLPKVKNNIIYNIDLPKYLKAQYFNIQFMNNNKLDNEYLECHYISKEKNDIIEEDFHLCEKILDVKIKPVKNSAFWIGKKYMTFWGVPERVEYTLNDKKS